MNNIVNIIKIAIIILELIREGLSESDAAVVMSKFDVSEELVKRLL